MEKPRSASVSGGAAASHNAVFIDTSLDTHLAVIVSDSDTVSDLKKKILNEHPLCFPSVGGIKIHSLKVKRRGHFYHLSDSMFVKSAFEGICKSWFLSVDASRSEERMENLRSGEPRSGNLGAGLGIMDSVIDDGIGVVADGAAKRFSDVNDSALPQVWRDWQGKEKPSADFDTDINCNVLSIDTDNRSGPELKEKHEVDSNKYKDPVDKHNFRNVVDEAQFSLSLDGGPETGTIVKKKGKTKKERKDRSLDHGLKENDASTQGPDRNVSRQDLVVPDNSLVTEDKRPAGEVQMTNVLSNGTAGNHVECKKDASMNLSMEEAFPVPTKKKQKTVNNKNSSVENRVLYNSTNSTSGPGITISQSSLVDKQKGVNVTVDHLSSEISKDDHLLPNGPSTRKRKRKSKPSKDANEEVASVPNFADNDRVQSPRNAVASHDKDSERELIAPVVPEKVVPGAMISEPCSISVKEKLSVPVQQVGENNLVLQSVDVDMSSADAGNVEGTNDPPEAAAASAIKGMRISDDCRTIEAEGNLHVAVQQGNDLKDTGVVEPVKSSKKKKKSKKTQDPVSVSQVTLGIGDTCTIETQGNPSVVVQEINDLGKDTGVAEHGNVLVNDCQKFGSDQMARAEAERELSQNNDPTAIASGKCTPFSGDEIDINSKVGVTSDLLDTNDNAEPGKSLKNRKKSAKSIPFSGGEVDTNSKVEVTSNPLDTNDVGECGKSTKKKKKSKKTQDPVAVQQIISGPEHKICSVIGTSLTEKHEPVHNDHLSDKSGNEKGILFPCREDEESNAKTVDASSLATDRETDKVIQNVLEALQDLSKNPERVANEVKKSRKKTKRKQSSSTKSVPELQNEDENISFKNAKLAADATRELEVEASSILTKTNLAKTSTDHQLNASNWGPGNNAGVEADPLHSQLNAKSSQALSYQPEGNNEESPLQGKNSNFHRSGCADKANIHREASCESDRTIVNDNFVPSQNQPEAVVSPKAPDNKVEASKDQNKFNVHSSSPSPDLHGSMKLYESKRSGEKAQAFNSITVKPQSLLSKGEDDNLKHHPKMKLSEVSATGRKVPPLANKSDKSNSKTKDAVRHNTVNASSMKIHSNTNRTIAASNSSLESFKRTIPQKERVNGHQSKVAVGKKISNNDNGEVLNSSERKKSLLATSGTIFKDNDWSSDDEGVDNSDASTKTPSDNSLSSDYSDGDSSAPRPGSYSPKTDERRRKNISKSHSSLNLDAILRSSSRYKAAKLTASQSQPLDFDSQPDEIVPDSQPNQQAIVT